jgi:class 3 adenylate cyclase
METNWEKKYSSSLCLRPLLEALNQNKDFDKYRNRIENAVAPAYVAFVDISGFSSKIKDYETTDVKNYLKEYYEKIIPIIEEFHGQIDKMMGDGIIVVFSDIFGCQYPDGIGECCLNFCKKCIETLERTEYAVKAAIGSGILNFCKTGVVQAYEEYSCIGHPMTVAFRLEQYAEKNQIWMLASDPIASCVKMDGYWMGHEEDVFLKGLDETKAFMCEYNSVVGGACECLKYNMT